MLHAVFKTRSVHQQKEGRKRSREGPFESWTVNVQNGYRLTVQQCHSDDETTSFETEKNIIIKIGLHYTRLVETLLIFFSCKESFQVLFLLTYSTID